MAKKRVSKKKRLLSVVKSSPAKSGLKSVSMKPDYFARYRYSLEEILIILKTEPVRTLHANSQTREILDDLGYWSLVRSEFGDFNFDNELQEQIQAQFKYLQSVMSYSVSDIVWAKKFDGSFAQARIIDHVNADDTDFYAIEFGASDSDSNNSKSNENSSLKETQVYSKYELDQINHVGCFLPQDSFDTELIDWEKDLIWRKKLEDFKVKMVEKKFQIDFRNPALEIEAKLAELTDDILEYFKITIGDGRQFGRGMGLLSCGEGNKQDQYLIYMSAFQAVGHIFGIKLTQRNYLAVDFYNEINSNNLSLESFRSISEVAHKLVARGPLAIDNEQCIKAMDRITRKSVNENYLKYKKQNLRRALLQAISEAPMFSNLVKLNANSI